MPCFLAGVGGEIGDLHFSLDRNCYISPPSFVYKVDVSCFVKSVLFSVGFPQFTRNIVAFASNRITPPSPHCLRL